MQRSTSAAVALIALVAALSGCGNRSQAYCQEALREANQLIAAQSSSNQTPIPNEPFMTQCRSMSADAAHCAVFSYYNTHPVECRQYESQLQALRRIATH